MGMSRRQPRLLLRLRRVARRARPAGRGDRASRRLVLDARGSRGVAEARRRVGRASDADHRPLLVQVDLLPRAERRPLRDRDARSRLRDRRAARAPRRAPDAAAELRASPRPAPARADAIAKSAGTLRRNAAPGAGLDGHTGKALSIHAASSRANSGSIACGNGYSRYSRSAPASSSSFFAARPNSTEMTGSSVPCPIATGGSGGVRSSRNPSTVGTKLLNAKSAAGRGRPAPSPSAYVITP